MIDTRTLLNEVRDSYGIPGMAVIVIRDGQPVVYEVLGERRYGFADKIAASDCFHLGSVTKPFTSTMVATLVEAGVMDWHTTLGDIFSEDDLHPALHGVTVAQLLSHWSGVQPFTQDTEFETVPKFSGTSQEKRLAFVHWLIKQQPFLAPGTKHQYSNAGYTIAATIAELRTGKSWEDLMRKRVFEPLSMHSAGFGWPAIDQPNQPWGHREIDGKPVPHDPQDTYQLENTYVGPAGDIHCNMEDLGRFISLHVEGLRGRSGILHAETIKRLHDAPVNEYALGWNIGDDNSQHLGSAGTFFACILLMPKDNLAFGIATNYAFQQHLEFAGTLLSRLKKAVSERA